MTVHVVGAGLAGLSTAVRLVQAGQPVALWEATAQAGGRCRTFRDPRLDRDIDNGNHLLLSGNTSARAYLDLTGGAARMVTLDAARFAFFDAATGRRWAVHMNDGPIPWWVFDRKRRIPGTRLRDYAAGLRLALAGPERTVADVVHPSGPLWQGFWEPLTLAVLNTTPDRGQARLLWRAMAETFARGGARSRPMLAPDGLGRALVDPALSWLAVRGTRPAFDHALKVLDTAAGRATALTFANGHRVDLDRGDRVVLALPPSRLKPILPDLPLPEDRSGILNAHFTLPGVDLTARPPITGLVNATTHWVFVRGDVVSLTVSAADRLGLMDRAPDELIPVLWDEAARALDITAPYAAARINKERRATFDQSPAGARLRPGARTPLTNLFLAGDCTDTGLPATIEGALRSGEMAARLAAQ